MKYELEPLHRNTPDQVFLDDLKRVAKELGAKTVSMSQYSELGRFDASSLWRRFGSWTQALECAGLVAMFRNIKFTEEELFSNLVDVWAHFGRQPRCDDLTSKTSRISVDAYKRRFGGWRKALEAFVLWANEGEISPLSIASTAASIPKASRNISDRLRFLVMRRDNFKCMYCGASPAMHAGIELHLDHRTPFSQGGASDFDNLVTACSKCNLGKGDISAS